MQYWMDIVKWERGEHAISPKKPANKKKQGPFDWDAATDWLDQLKSKVNVFRKRKPGHEGRFADSLIRFADELRHDVWEFLGRNRGDHVMSISRGGPSAVFCRLD
jgi:hypothetical protein